MARINLESEPRFKEIMKLFGFKKTKYGFVRHERESIMKLSFGYGTYGQKFVRYYDCMYSIVYPKIEALADSIGEYVCGPHGQIGYLTPENRFREWKLADSDSDEYYLHMINDIKEIMGQYVIPYMEKYSTIEAFVKGVESGNISRNFFDSKAVAIAYVLLGRKDDALHYLDQCIEEQKNMDIYGKGVEVVETKEYREEIYYPQENRNLKGLLLFSQKLKDREISGTSVK